MNRVLNGVPFHAELDANVHYLNRVADEIKGIPMA